MFIVIKSLPGRIDEINDEGSNAQDKYKNHLKVKNRIYWLVSEKLRSN